MVHDRSKDYIHVCTCTLCRFLLFILHPVLSSAYSHIKKRVYCILSLAEYNSPHNTV